MLNLPSLWQSLIEEEGMELSVLQIAVETSSRSQADIRALVGATGHSGMPYKTTLNFPSLTEELLEGKGTEGGGSLVEDMEGTVALEETVAMYNS